MKENMYAIFGALIMPFVLVGAILYSVSYLLQMFFRTIIIFLDKAMKWVDKNITQNIRN